MNKEIWAKLEQFTEMKNTMIAEICVKDFEKLAKHSLDKAVFDFISGGAMDEITLQENEKSYDQIKIMPRVLRGVSTTDTSISIFGNTLNMPIFIAPMAFQKLSHVNGEQETAIAARQANIIMIISTYSTIPLKIIKSELLLPPWFQIYIMKDRSLTKSLIELAESEGCQALVLTVDATVYGKRKRELLNPICQEIILPDLLMLQNRSSSKFSLRYAKDLSTYLDPTISWKDIEWIKSVTKLPLCLKGIIRADDATLAEQHGIDGIIISNHGGRQLDTMLPPIFALPSIKEAVSNKINILIDGGIRRGTDILKAIALGADAVLIGRPILWSLAMGGQEGVYQVLNILNDELKQAMTLSGCKKISEISKDLIYKLKT